MTTLNPYFENTRRGLNPNISQYGDNGSNANEIDTMKSLQKECVQMWGVLVRYIVRTNNTIDDVFGESVGSNFEHSFEIEMMPEDDQLMKGTDTIMSFGWNMTDTIVLHVSFDRIVDELRRLNIPERTYPMVGDLIEFGVPGNIMEIKFVDDKLTRYAMGVPSLYSLYCQVYDYSQETFSTDIPHIDIINDYTEMYVEPESDNRYIKAEAKEYLAEEPNDWPGLKK